jgi:hypothetical protein
VRELRLSVCRLVWIFLWIFSCLNVFIKFFISYYDDLQKHFCIIGWCLVRHKIHWLGSTGLWIQKSIAKKETHYCDSTAEKKLQIFANIISV